MSDIYTRSGDDGTTSLPHGGRARKDDPVIGLLGALDEANCAVGFARPVLTDPELDGLLGFIQQRLFNCGSTLGAPSSAPPPKDSPSVTAEDVAALERAIDRWSSRGGSFKGFVLPGCDEASARLHVARAAVRRAERAAASVHAVSALAPAVLAFLNRASDALYVAARYTGAGNECPWKPDSPAPY